MAFWQRQLPKVQSSLSRFNKYGKIVQHGFYTYFDRLQGEPSDRGFEVVK
jgi:hypothetical protein